MALRSSSRVRNTNNAARRAQRRGIYIYDNTARALDMESELDVDLKRERIYKARKSRDKASHMNSGYVMFLAMALLVSAAILISYVQLRSDITASVNHISVLESRLNSIKQSNDEEYSRIENSVSIEEVKRIAIEQLGMTYAAEGQVVRYDPSQTDYVRQVAEIPKS